MESLENKVRLDIHNLIIHQLLESKITEIEALNERIAELEKSLKNLANIKLEQISLIRGSLYDK
jgi:polyhydroxyalkanoate synthesis regulator phasin